MIYNRAMSVKHIENYSIIMGQMLGQGNYGSVYMGKNRKGEEVAVKIVTKDNSNLALMKSTMTIT